MKITKLKLALIVTFISSTLFAQQNYELNSTVDGTKMYIAPEYVKMLPGFHTQPAGNDYVLAKINPYILSAGNILPHDITPPTTTSSITPGIVEGEFSVSSLGAGIYQIPIKVVPGTAGMTPQLALTYNSQTPNGLLGIGWSLKGLSTISRTSATIFHDAVYEPVDLDSEDKFELDGQRLICINGNYGEDGAEYRTESDQFSRIFSYGYSVSGPEKFIVYTKSGLIKEYGYTTDSRIEAQGKQDVIFWHVNKILDTKGNYIKFYYNEDNTNGEYNILKIEYTGNDETGLVPYAKVEFVYENRSDQTTIYLNGAKSVVTKRLNGILCKYENSCKRSYRFTYSYLGVGGRTHLTSVKEIGADGTRYYNSTVFEWEIPGTAVSNQIYDQSYYATNYATYNSKFYLADFNGDGRQDFITVANTEHPTNPTWTGWKLFIANENGVGFQYQTSGTLPAGFKDIYTGDFNGDGCADFLASYVPSATLTALESVSAPNDNITSETVTLEDYPTVYDNPQPSESQNSIEYGYTPSGSVAQANTTAVTALATSSSDPERRYVLYLYNRSTETLEEKYNYPYQFSCDVEHDLFIGDFDADGISDCFVKRNVKVSGKVDWLIYRGKENSGLSWFKSGTIPTWGEEAQMIEFDGDGRPDFFVLETDGCCVYQFDGNTFIEPYSSTWPQYGHILQYGDYNGDGKTDIMAVGWEDYNWDTWSISNSTGTNLVRNYFSSKKDIRKDKFYMGDFNADGKTDFVVMADASKGGTWTGRELWLADGAGTDFVQGDEGPVYPSLGQNFYFGDFTGDGKTDFFITDAESVWWNGYQFYTTERQTNELMVKVTDGLGLQTRLVYKPITHNSVYTKYNTANYPLADIEAPLFVVDSVFRETGSGDFLSTSYHYSGAVIHKQGKGFLGFRKIESTDNETGIKTIQEFSFNNPYFNPEQKTFEKRLSDNTLIEKSSFTYDYKNISGTKVFFPYIPESTVESRKLDGTLYNTVVSAFTCDDYGNVLTTNVNHNNGFATETSTNQYDNIIATDKWHLGRLTRSEVTKTRDGQTPVTRVSAFEYNSESGLLEKEIVEPGNSTYSYEKIYTHDDFGNIEETRYTRSGLEDRITSSVYDTKGRFEIQTKNALGHVSTKTYDDFYGNVTQAVSANGLMTQFVYDNFGNLLKTVAPDGNVAVSKDLWVETGDADAPTRAVYYSWGQASGGPVTKVYYDKQGRPLRKVTTGFGGNIIYVDTEYNDIGQVEAVSDPYFEGNTLIWTNYEYDVLGRVAEQTLPGNRVTSTTYNGLETTVTGPLNKTITKTTDVLGNLVTSEDHDGNTITYHYFSSGLLKEVVAPGSAYNINMDYDLLGNQTLLDDPNLGTVDYTYNVYGELLTQTDEGGSTSMEYDLLGRLVKRTASEGITVKFHHVVEGFSFLSLRSEA
jgi:YD repeat-containing protein